MESKQIIANDFVQCSVKGQVSTVLVYKLPPKHEQTVDFYAVVPLQFLFSLNTKDVHVICHHIKRLIKVCHFNQFQCTAGRPFGSNRRNYL